MSLGTFIMVSTEDDRLTVQPDQQNEIRKAYRDWIERGIDTVLDLTQTNGDLFVLTASQIISYLVSTPDGRQRHAEEAIAAKSETQAIRTALGLGWEDGE